MADVPLLVFGPRSLDYDFGPSHPLTPRRFGPGIDLLRELGAVPGLAPEPASDDELLLVHEREYVEVVKRFSEFEHGWMEPEAGIGVGGDNPPFHAMHDAAAAVAGGSLRAMEAILRGDVSHAFHPGGGLHHAMPGRASGFCIYDDPALAIARARRAGHRVLYIDLDVHHGDGVEAIHAADPGVLTISFHESGRFLFPGTGFLDQTGDGPAAGTVVNVPLEAETGEVAWLEAVRLLVPEIAATFGPDIVVSQHGADSHAWDPLAHLRNTTTAMGEAARLVDSVAHRFADGRWLATGGGGYGVYDVVPRSWSLVWLAAAHRPAPEAVPASWRARWADEAARHGVQRLPTTLIDPANLGEPRSRAQELAERQSAITAGIARELAVPRLLRVARERGWWDPITADMDDAMGRRDESRPQRGSAPVRAVDEPTWHRLELAPRVISPADPVTAHRLIAAALRDGARVVAAVDDRTVIGLGVALRVDGVHEVLAIGVAPRARRKGLASRLLAALLEDAGPEAHVHAAVGIGERDVVEPLDHAARIGIARRLLVAAGFRVERARDPIGRLDPLAIEANRGG